MGVIGHFIGGRHLKLEGGNTLQLIDPATGHALDKVSLGGAQDIQAAVEAAQAALPSWSATPPVRRAAVLFRFRDLIEKHADELAALITREHGKVLADARGSLQRGLEVVEFACGIPHLLTGEFLENVGINPKEEKKP